MSDSTPLVYHLTVTCPNCGRSADGGNWTSTNVVYRSCRSINQFPNACLFNGVLRVTFRIIAAPLATPNAEIPDSLHQLPINTPPSQRNK